jgi:serine/threonine-protein kinase HipA
MSDRCLYCYRELEDGQKDFHPACARKFFGSKSAPLLPYTRDNIDALALEVLRTSASVPGVQAKLSLDLNRGGKNEPDRLTIVGLWGNFILKPQSPVYDSLPELEDVTMKLAAIAGIETAPHSLIRMADGEMAYITRRMDRSKDGRKFSMLDMCQLTNRLTEHKYLGSYSQLSDVIRKYSEASMLDVQRFWEIVIFSWITGNSDMHCKNFSLIERESVGYVLAPSYDLLSVLLTGIADNDELAMPLSGYESENLSGFTRKDFLAAMTAAGITGRICDKIIDHLAGCRGKWFAMIDSSFLKDSLKTSYKALIDNRLSRL